MSIELPGWERLRHGGLLLDGPRFAEITRFAPAPLDQFTEHRLRKLGAELLNEAGDATSFISFVLERVCGFDAGSGTWSRGSQVATTWTRKAISGESIRPHQLWQGPRDALLPVFYSADKRIGIGRGRRIVSQVLGWLRAGGEHLALVTNGYQWRLIFAGLDYDAWCEWDVDLWFEEGGLSPQVMALRTLLQPRLFAPETKDANPPLLQAIHNTRKGQAELSEVLGERVREAVEILIQGYGDTLREPAGEHQPADIYRAACRVIMRLVIVLFAEARELLPRSNPVYHENYGLNGLLERLERIAVHGAGRLASHYSAWPRILALFRLVREGSHHPDLPVPAYGSELFAPGNTASDGLAKALAVFEGMPTDLEQGALADTEVYEILRLLTRTRIRIQQGRASTWARAPVDFSGISTEYIGILYEGLLDYELKSAPANDPVVFLSVGDQPALPLSRLEDMDKQALKALFKTLKDSGASDTADDDEAGPGDLFSLQPVSSREGELKTGNVVSLVTPEYPVGSRSQYGAVAEVAPEYVTDVRFECHRRVEAWANRAIQAAGKAIKQRKQDNRPGFQDPLANNISPAVSRVVLPGEWYLVRWGGTRKGSGSFYTRPGLAVPTVQRTLRPLAYDPPVAGDGSPDRNAAAAHWTPKRPEEILALKVCDPACGSGTFPLAALRFLTDALYAALQHHGRILPDGQRTLVRLLSGTDQQQRAETEERLDEELIPCPPDDDNFETRLKAVLRRHVVERCIYAVDLDPLAVELCRLALWIETMDRTLPFGFIDHKIKCGNALIGAWFDQFRHYPVMAWKNREGGDKTHANGIHYTKNARTKVIKTFIQERLARDLKLFLQGRDLFQEDLLEEARTAHSDALETLRHIHEMPVHEAAERGDVYRRDFLGSESWRSLKTAMDLWCACWFWPVDQIEHAPLPTSFADPPEETRAIAEQVAAQARFFHWELEFPDVFRERSTAENITAGNEPADNETTIFGEGNVTGFDAILGNPPWDIAKPVSKEFFSNIDPLYRSYGKQEALRRQNGYFKQDAAIEREWLDYNARFRAQSNFMSYAANPFGDPETSGKSQNRFAVARGGENHLLHDRWRDARALARGYADLSHPFRHQGSADLNLYKLFLEAAYTLLRDGGRLGFVVPSGLYSDDGTRALRNLFLNECNWEWLFGIENRNKVFPIDSRFKFNLIIVEKGGKTDAIRSVFMRRNLEDWERAEEITVPYTPAQVDRFSPRSRALLEIQNQRDLEILEKIYSNSVLLGDDGPDGWGIRYATEFHMTGDSKLFPPRQQWEAEGYRPDEYSRWLKGDWRPIEELWAELSVNLSQPVPAEINLENWLFDTTADPERRQAEARFLHGHLLKPGDVARTEWQLRCAQPPYDRLPIPRADIPEGVILSRDGDAWVREERVEGVALPVYVGKMIYVGNWAASTVERGYPSRLDLDPDFLLSADDLRHTPRTGSRVVFRDISNSTNERGFVSALIPGLFPCGNSSPVLESGLGEPRLKIEFATYLSSLAFDWATRQRMSGTHINWHIAESLGLPPPNSALHKLCKHYANIALSGIQFAGEWLRLSHSVPRARLHACAHREQVRIIAIVNAVVATIMGLSTSDLRYILAECDYPRGDTASRQPKGFWRVDKDKDPELRQTVLTLVAFHDLERKIQQASGDQAQGTNTFLAQNNGEGWLLPETLCLTDYGLGHDDRAKHPQPVASRLGPRFYDWQLVQSADESWRECHLHARNLLGDLGYRQLIESIKNPYQRDQKNVPLAKVAEEPANYDAETREISGNCQSAQFDIFK